MIDTIINQKKGCKEITLTTSIKFFNYMNTEIYIGFKRTGS